MQEIDENRGPRWYCQATCRKERETISGREQPEERTTSTSLPGLSTERLFLFGDVKRKLQGTEFQTAEELLEAAVQILSETLIATFHQWMESLRPVLIVTENMWNKEVFYSKNFCLSPMRTEMLRGELNTLSIGVAGRYPITHSSATS
jgi:hypothetical protein